MNVPDGKIDFKVQISSLLFRQVVFNEFFFLSPFFHCPCMSMQTNSSDEHFLNAQVDPVTALFCECRHKCLSKLSDFYVWQIGLVEVLIPILTTPDKKKKQQKNIQTKRKEKEPEQYCAA